MMKRFTCLLLAGILIQCITVTVASPLDKTKLSSANDVESNQRTKREPDVALVLSIIDKKSRKIKKIEIGVDDDGFDINDRRPTITSDEGKRLITKLLQDGGVQIKSNVAEKDAKSGKWEELFETLQDANESERSHTQKITKGHSSDDDKLDKILQFLAKLNEKNGGSQSTENCENSDCENDNDVKRKPKPEHISGRNDDTQESKRRPKPPHVDAGSSEDCDDCDENNNDVKRRPKPVHIDDKYGEPEDTQGSVKRKPKPSHSDESPEDCEDCDENKNDVKRRPKPLHIDDVDEDSDEELQEPDSRAHRRPKPQHNRYKDKDTQGSVKRRPKPSHIDESPEDCEDCDENKNDVKRRPKPAHIEDRDEDSDEELEEPDNRAHRRPKPQHNSYKDKDTQGSAEDPEDTQGSVKRRPKPSRSDEGPEDCEDCDENSNDVKRKPKPVHVDDGDETSDEELEKPDNRAHRRPKPQHNHRDKDTQGSVKRKPKPSHIDVESPEDCEDCEENNNDVKRRPKPVHIDEKYEEPDDTQESVKRRPKPSHIDVESTEDCEDCDETNNDVKRRPKPLHIDDGDETSDEELEEPDNRAHRRPKPQHNRYKDKDTQGSVKRKPKPSHIDVESPEDCEDCEENNNDVKRRPKPVHIDDKTEEPEDTQGSVKRRPKPSHIESKSSEECEDCDGNGNDVKRQQKPKHIYDKESDNEDEENQSCPDDLDEEQLLQGIAFVQSQLKRFLGIECTCNPTENTVLKEDCPIHKTSSARRRREHQDESVLSGRSSAESRGKISKSKKFTKKASVKDVKKGNSGPKKITNKPDLTTANSIAKQRVIATAKHLPRVTADDIINLLKELGLSADKVTKSEITPTNSRSPSKKHDTANDDLQFFRNESSVHRSSANGESSSKKNRRKLRNRRKGRKASSSRDVSATSIKRKQRGIESDEIAAKQDETSPLHNYKAEGYTEEILLSRPVESAAEDSVDPDIEILKSIFAKYKEHAAAVKQNDNVMVETSDESPSTSTDQDSRVEGTEPGITESVENILKEVSEEGNGWTDDSDSSKEYVIAQVSDSNYRDLYKKFASLFGDTATVDSDSSTTIDGDK
ncbi:nucleolar protein dao-5-like [Bradysia coprophila]|uniref:nucleolar protein dao-5-like n=1 Tax=Bradysia coprophila TaxID=38358 RepID=UPI00187D7CA2|nr:nucleolar protein dao-5-like [Bradysia coprophila]